MNDNMRIKYKSDNLSASTDKSIFSRWEDGVITTRKAIILLEKSVDHPINEEQFVINANNLGYYRGGKEK